MLVSWPLRVLAVFLFYGCLWFSWWLSRRLVVGPQYAGYPLLEGAMVVFCTVATVVAMAGNDRLNAFGRLKVIRVYRIIAGVSDIAGVFLIVVGGVIYRAFSLGVSVALLAALMLLGAGAYPLASWVERHHPANQV